MPALSNNTQSAILERVVQPNRSRLSKAAAESMLELKFAAKDLRRMEVLLASARAGVLTAEETGELDDYRNVGRMLDLLKSQARQVIAS